MDEARCGTFYVVCLLAPSVGETAVFDMHPKKPIFTTHKHTPVGAELENFPLIDKKTTFESTKQKNRDLFNPPSTPFKGFYFVLVEGIIKKEEKGRKEKEGKREEKEEKREKEKEGKEKEGVNIEVPQLIPILPMLSVRGVLDGIAAGNAVGELVGLSVSDDVGV